MGRNYEIQRRVQDFPEVGANLNWMGQPIILPKFPENFIKIKTIICRSATKSCACLSVEDPGEASEPGDGAVADPGGVRGGHDPPRSCENRS